jgi:hypothetical protein
MAHNLFRTSLEKLQKDPMKMRIKINTVYVSLKPAPPPLTFSTLQLHHRKSRVAKATLVYIAGFIGRSLLNK